MKTTFTLRIRYQEDGSCSFELTWGTSNVYVNQPYSLELDEAYQSWKKCYLRYYKFQSSTSSNNSNTSGSIPVLSGDSSQDLRTAEKVLLDTFLQWLGEGKTQKIERCIRDELVRLMQTSLETNAEFTSGKHHIDIYLFCDSNLNKTLIRLPWETWVASRLAPQDSPNQPIRLIRTVQDNPQGLQHSQILWRAGKPRILAILGDDPTLPLTEDWRTLRSLESVATVTRVSRKLEESADDIKARVQAKIKDDRGWDILFFAGHSHEATINGGSFELAPDVIFSMRDLTEHLDDARNQGLQLAVFNSCSGIDIGKSLARQGIQAVVMREPIHNDVALTFLQQLCKHLKQYQNIYEATSAACQTLYNERNNAPSTYLIPSFFSPANVPPFQLKPVKWKARLKQWIPTKREVIALGTALLLSNIPGVKDALLEVRVAAQSIYRDLTDQFESSTSPPPVHLIAVDQKSLDDANASEKPISQEFLANVIEKVSTLEPKTVGLAYILHRRQEEWEQLRAAIEKSAQEHQTWFIFAISERKSFEGFLELRNLEDGIRGDFGFNLWNLDLPTDTEYENICPFNYLLALSHFLSKQDSALADLSNVRSLINQELVQQGSNLSGGSNDFCRHIISSPEIVSKHREIELFVQKSRSFWNWQSIIDFSIPPNLAYERTPVWDLPQKIETSINKDTSDTQLEKNLGNTTNQVVIIGPSGYEDAEDRLYAPLAVRYWWCLSEKGGAPQNCPRTRWFSSTEAHSYMVSQLLSQRLVTVVPSYLLIGLAAILGKGGMRLLVCQPTTRRKRSLNLIFVGTSLYGIISLQLYLSVGIVLPWLFPSAIFLSYFRATYGYLKNV